MNEVLNLQTLADSEADDVLGFASSLSIVCSDNN